MVYEDEGAELFELPASDFTNSKPGAGEDGAVTRAFIICDPSFARGGLWFLQERQFLRRESKNPIDSGQKCILVNRLLRK